MSRNSSRAMRFSHLRTYTNVPIAKFVRRVDAHCVPRALTNTVNDRCLTRRTARVYNCRSFSVQAAPHMVCISPQLARFDTSPEASLRRSWSLRRSPARRRVEVRMDSVVNQLARELTEAISAAVADDARVEACREKARAAGSRHARLARSRHRLRRSREDRSQKGSGAQGRRPRSRVRDERQRSALPQVAAHLGGRTARKKKSSRTPSVRTGRTGWPSRPSCALVWRPPRPPCAPLPDRPDSSAGSAQVARRARRPAESLSGCSARRSSHPKSHRDTSRARAGCCRAP